MTFSRHPSCPELLHLSQWACSSSNKAGLQYRRSWETQRQPVLYRLLFLKPPPQLLLCSPAPQETSWWLTQGQRQLQLPSLPTLSRIATGRLATLFLMQLQPYCVSTINVLLLPDCSSSVMQSLTIWMSNIPWHDCMLMVQNHFGSDVFDISNLLVCQHNCIAHAAAHLQACSKYRRLFAKLYISTLPIALTLLSHLHFETPSALCNGSTMPNHAAKCESMVV